jgi:transposase InsO family protein
MEREVRTRLQWIELYQKTGDAGLTCRRCGISRPTLRKWWKRYNEQGLAGLASHSRRPHSHPARKVTSQEELWILELRKERKLGARRIQNELVWQHDCHLSLATIHKVLKRNAVPLCRKLRRRKKAKRYAAAIPGQRVQMDTCKLQAGLYLYTAIDDCSRFIVTGVYSRRTAANTLHFLDERVLEEMPMPIQRLQTDRGAEFMAMKVQMRLRELCIKYRPTRPGAPYLNGKVERAQKTILEECCATLDLSDPELADRLDEWQFYYNWQRVHGSLGKPPIDKLCEHNDEIPTWSDIEAMYDPSRERFRERDFQQDLLMEKLWRRLPAKAAASLGGARPADLMLPPGIVKAEP